MSIIIKHDVGRAGHPWGSYDPGRNKIEIEGDKGDIRTWFVVLHEIGHALLQRTGNSSIPKPMLSGREIIRQELMAWRIGASMLKPEFLSMYAEFALRKDNLGSYLGEFRAHVQPFKRALRVLPLRVRAGRLGLVEGNSQDRIERAFVSMILGYPVG